VGVLTSVGPQVLVAAFLSFAAIVTTAVMKFMIVNRALEGTKPNERPWIIRELRGLWKSDWQLGPLGRTKSSEQARQNDEGVASSRKMSDTDEVSEPPALDR
jgi:hypothetical protein